MGRIVYAGATSHVSLIIRKPHAHPDRSSRLDAAWRQMTADIAQAGPDVVVIVATDHYETFHLENYPTFCIGAAPAHEAWNEFGTPGHTVTGDEKTGSALHASLVAAGFDVSRSMEMPLDHSFMVPIQRLGIGRRRIVPLFVNCNTPPLPSLRRCHDLGVALRGGIELLPDDITVAVVGTGGVSHWVGLPRTGEINEDWDRAFLGHVTAGELDPIVAMSDEQMAATAGNGALEVRTWLVAHGCAGGAGGRLLGYAPMPDWGTGIGIVELKVAS
jgi:aromatic ring-opening dioxygenase catalytic subunit (LigB family)